MTSDNEAAEISHDIPALARSQFIARLVDDNHIRLTTAGLAAWNATHDQTLGHFLVEMTTKHPGREVWSGTDVQMLPDFIMERIDRIADELREVIGEVDEDALRVAAESVISSADTKRRCRRALLEYQAVLGGADVVATDTIATPICPQDRPWGRVAVEPMNLPERSSHAAEVAA